MNEKPELLLFMFGYRARLIIELEGGEHDISRLLEVAPSGEAPNSHWRGGWTLSATALANELQVEQRARERALRRD